MAENILDDSTLVENLPLSVRVVYTEGKEFGVIRVPLKPWLAQQKLSFTHDYLRSLSIAIERMLLDFDAKWIATLRKSEDIK